VGEVARLSLFDLFGLIRAVGFLATVESLAHVRGIAGLKNEVQYSAAGAEASGHAVRGVMIEVMLLHVTEIRIAKTAEVGRVMDPLFGDVGLESEGHHNRSSEGWEEKNTKRHAGKKERQQIAHATTHVLAIEGFFVMSEMRWIEILVRHARPESLVPALRYLPMTVQHIAVRKVFRQHPKHYAEGNEGQRSQKMMRTSSQHQQDNRVGRVKSCGAIDLSPRDDFLLALVDAIGVFPAHV